MVTRSETQGEQDERLAFPEAQVLPGSTVDRLLQQGRIADARVELERILLDGVESGPGTEVTPATFEQLRARVSISRGR